MFSTMVLLKTVFKDVFIPEIRSKSTEVIISVESDCDVTLCTRHVKSTIGMSWIAVFIKLLCFLTLNIYVCVRIMNGQCMLFLEQMKKVCDFTVWDLRPVRGQESSEKEKKMIKIKTPLN